MDLYRLIPGNTRLLVSIPHAGTYVPPSIAARMTQAALTLPDTDWHVDRLYDFLVAMGATVLIATHSRYVVDLNRPADDSALYPGRKGTGLCPLDSFAGDPVWQPGQELAAGEIADRVARYWEPYHACLRAKLDELRLRHGSVELWHALQYCGSRFVKSSA